MGEWQTYRLGDICQVFDGPHATPTKTDFGPYFLNIGSLINGRLDLGESPRIHPDQFAKWTKRVQPQGGDLLFSYETRLGEAALMPTGVEACLGRRMGLLRFDRSKVDPDFFLYYWLSSEMQRLIDKNTLHGATVQRISIGDMPDWLVRLPDMRIQQRLSGVLRALDAKAWENRRYLLVADSMVRSLCKNASASSSTSVRLGSLMVEVRDVARTETMGESDRYVGLEHIPRRNIWADDWSRASKVTSHKSRFEAGDILFGKLRPYFHKVVAPGFGGVCSTDILVLRPVDPILRGLVLGAVSSDEVVAFASSISEGTRMPRVKWKDLAELEVAWPGRTEAVRVSSQVGSLLDLGASLVAENVHLTRMRDLLLPRLMDGTLTVRTAEELVGDVV